MEMTYLIDNSEREHEILERFHEFLNNIGTFLFSMGISPLYSWYLIEIKINRLVSSIEGDVDILAGRLEADDKEKFAALLDEAVKKYPDAHPSVRERLASIDLAWNGGLKWTPSLDYLVGIEAKCCYLLSNAPEITEKYIKSKKNSKDKGREIRKQVRKLLKMGFDKVGLFEFIANPPSDGVGSQPWFKASGIAHMSLQTMHDIFEKRLPENSPAGIGACSIGGIVGREETGSGAYSDIIFRQAQTNPHLSEKDVKDNRQEMEQNLTRILKSLPQPRVLPAVFVCDRKTHRISFVNQDIIRY